jgi:hypothetical protein
MLIGLLLPPLLRPFLGAGDAIGTLLRLAIAGGVSVLAVAGSHASRQTPGAPSM